MTSQNTIGATLPLMFTFRRVLFGHGFAVEVRVTNGRALCVHEHDSVWIYGINPGGMAASGETADAAREEFAKGFSEVLSDLVVEANSFDEFRGLVHQFFNETNDGYVSEWEAAVQAVRDEPALSASIDLPLTSADAPRTISVEMKPIVMPEDNTVNLEPAIAA